MGWAYDLLSTNSGADKATQGSCVSDASDLPEETSKQQRTRKMKQEEASAAGRTDHTLSAVHALHCNVNDMFGLCEPANVSSRCLRQVIK